MTLASQVVYRVVWSAVSGDLSAKDFAAHVERRPDELFLAGRLAGVLISLFSIALIYLLGASLFGATVGSIAALLLATNSYVILTSQHVVDPNLLAMTLVLAAMLPLIRGTGRLTPARAACAGAFVGLAAASKYIPLVLVLLFVPLCTRREETRWEVDWRALSAGAVSALGVFVLASPFLVLDWRTTLHDVAIQRERHGAEWVGQTQFAFALPTYLLETFPRTLGWVAYGLSLAGIARWLKTKTAWPIALAPALLLAVYGWLSVAQPRFLLPGYPFLILGAALAIVWLSDLATRGFSARWVSGGAMVILVLAAAFAPARDLLEARHDLKRPDSRREARRWILGAVPPSQALATDVYGPVFNTRGRERPVAVWPFYATEANLVGVAYAPCWLEGISYYAISQGVEGRFRVAADRYRQEVAFYDWIRDVGRRVWDSSDLATSGPEISVWALPSARWSKSTQDSLWDAGNRSPRDAARLSVWCLNMSEVTGSVGRPDLAMRWASRGLPIARKDLRERFFAGLAVSWFDLDEPESVLAVTATGLEEYPGDAVMHLYRGMTLQAVGRGREAAHEYAESLRLNPHQEGADRIRDQMRTLLTR
ncbi:MAG: ArnT family glycosyltransferase [Hyphomicrobiales bacterium]